jgi:hypothetical protein
MPSERGYQYLLGLQSYLNEELSILFGSILAESRDEIARKLIVKIEALVDDLNRFGYALRRVNYSGSIDYENSEQIYCNKSLNINFHGFSAQVSWDKW